MLGVDTPSVARRVTSRTLIGRAEQLSVLQAATATAATGSARIVLISGDAGIGKTRLIGEAVAQARGDGLVVAVGGCVQLGDASVAFAPLVEALRDLRAQLGDAQLDELLDSGVGQVRALLGGEGVPAQGSGPLFEHLLGFLTRLGARRPVLLVFEDLHWADASTRDLVAFLGRNLRDAAVTFVLTYRGDELHRRHPLRPVLADLDRDPRVERVQLTGLGRAELAGLLDDISDQPIPAETVDALLYRSGGNPFYVEELVASGGLDGRIPETLAEVILSRVARLSETTQGVLHAAALFDGDLDDELLADITARPIDDVAAALREAVSDQLLVLGGEACRFRHALVREALYDDLLPGERTRLHVATARALERSERGSEQMRWAMLAHHWDAARDEPKAFIASVRAGLEAEKVHAFGDAAEQYERALRLGEQVPDAEAAVGMSTADLLLRAADAVHVSSRAHRAVGLAQAALRELAEDTLPEKRALFLERLGRINWIIHDGPAAVAAYEEAVAILDGRPPSRERAFVLATLGQSLMLRARYREAVRVLRDAIAMAAELGVPDVEGHAQSSLGACLMSMGQIDEGVEAIRTAIVLCRGADDPDEVGRAYTNLVHDLYFGGRYDEAVRIGAEGLEYVIRSGYPLYADAVSGNMIAALFRAGRWTEANTVRTDSRIRFGDPYGDLHWLPVLMGSGRYEEARALVAETLAGTAEADDVQFRAGAFIRAGQMAAVDGHYDEARQFIADALAIIAQTDDQFYRASAFAVGLSVEADQVAAAQDRRDEDAVVQARAVADDLLNRVRAFTDEWSRREVKLLPETEAWIVTAAADHARAWGRDDAQTWSDVAAAWEVVGQPVRVATARWRQADALLRTRGDRAAAEALLRAALAVADGAGAVPLATDIRLLAQRGRLDLTAGEIDHAAVRDPVAALNVTPRELDVLRLLTDGRSNRQIGETLFISEKTASVHVSNLLRKLGVSSRVEAAAVAQRVGVTTASAEEDGG
jgi:DNA-binding CsgD family transcriptional regulator/phage gp36-like protein